MREQKHRVVIIGGGFGGLFAAKSLKKAPVEVTLIDRRNFHLFQPLLYQVATGGLSPANIASPLRGILKRQMNTRVLLGEVIDIDVNKRRVILKDGEILYDSLILSAGARHHYFNHPEWEKLAQGLKTIEDATEMRGRILYAFEQAERESGLATLKAWLTFVIVGAGPTGVELAGALAEIARNTLTHDFRTFNPADALVLLVEGTDRVLPPYPPDLSAKALQSLQRLGVIVRLDALITEIQSDSVTLKIGDQIEKIPTHTVLWAAGVLASPLGKKLAERTGAKLDRAGRILIEPDLTIPGHPEIFVIGDMASYCYQTERQLPGVCQVAMQQGKYAAQLIQSRLKKKTIKPFHYKNLGDMATIGRAAAVADFGWTRFSGWPAWVLWIFIHIFNLVEFENKLLVMVQWAWNYFRRNRSARLITEQVRTQRENS
ncbi:NAD(P)/FAD-dependent oxidoreductase [Candidatus Acetothermia bacterium]|nr:NAD(P)/FAD-dependent oxidoreductase [Candidatus Acetothermia bacterium]MBI3643040.1 NAD(P)/FAD-dependent oxidoreductase [Candidatus Acetothermia bacterium]